LNIHGGRSTIGFGYYKERELSTETHHPTTQFIRKRCEGVKSPASIDSYEPAVEKTRSPERGVVTELTTGIAESWLGRRRPARPADHRAPRVGVMGRDARDQPGQWARAVAQREAVVARADRPP
jgi:hypothetical protein